MSTQETIEGSGWPLGYKVRQGTRRPAVLGGEAARDVFVTESRPMNHFQKEAVVTEGEGGSSWRLSTDEGKHIGGADVAPFPLGFYNAGLHGDLVGRILTLARVRGMAIDDLSVELVNGYMLQGSFVRGDGIGSADPAQIDVRIASGATPADVRRLVDDAVAASPAIDTMRTAFENTFAIYINGRRRVVTTLANSDAPDAPDPYRTYTRPPAPLDGAGDLADLIRKTGEIEGGELPDARDGAIRKTVRQVVGVSKLIDPAGVTETDTWLRLPGVSHFTMKSDERTQAYPDADRAPSGLALLSASIVFCYMTQLSRYIEHQKFDIDGVRIVQYTPYVLTGSAADGTLAGRAEPADTHLFLNGDEGDEVHERLMTIAAKTCYLHATMAAALVPVVSVTLNGKALDSAQAAE